MELLLTILPFLIPLPLLLAASGFFSGSETALFSLRQDERLRLMRRGGVVAGAARSLLADQRMLLITILLGNMAVNVGYFVLSSVLLMQVHRQQGPTLLLIVLPPLQLIALILFGEVLPKVLADRDRTWWISYTAIPLVTLHRLIAPIRLIANAAIIEPLTRLTAPTSQTGGLDAAELEDLLRLSADQGVIDDAEERLLSEVVQLSNLKVADVMVPRTDVWALPADAGPDAVREVLRQRRVTKIPIHDGGLDRIVGILHVKHYLSKRSPPPVGRFVTPAVYVPEVADLEALIDELRSKHVSIAVVVDEYGGTAGLVALEDALRPLLSDSIEPARQRTMPDDQVQQLGERSWRLPGRLRIRDWDHVLGPAAQAPGVSTLAGLVVSKLGRFPRAGDSVTISNLRFEVERVRGLRVEMVRIDIIEPPSPRRAAP